MWVYILLLGLIPGTAAYWLTVRKKGQPMLPPGIPGVSEVPQGSGAQAIMRNTVELQANSAFGIDVSAAQGGSIDWQKVKDEGGVQFAIIKLTEADAGRDKYGQQNATNARAVGLPISFYHFAHYQGDPVGQAKLFAAEIKKAGGADFPPTLDFEQVGSNMLSPLPPMATCQWAIAFIRALKAEGFPVVWVYTYPSYVLQLGTAVHDSGLADECELWIADYGKGAHPAPGSIPATLNTKSALYLKDTWKTWACWQTHGNDDKGAAPGSPGAPRIPGIPNAVDHDYYNGTLDEMKGKLLRFA